MITTTKNLVSLHEEETKRFIDWIADVEKKPDLTIFEKNQLIATRLGAHYRSDGLTEVGFWSPKLIREVMHPKEIYLEIFTPTEEINWRQRLQEINFRRNCVYLKRRGKFFWGVVEGMQGGTKEKSGSFYWLRHIAPSGEVEIIRDVMAYSLPYGIFG